VLVAAIPLYSTHAEAQTPGSYRCTGAGAQRGATVNVEATASATPSPATVHEQVTLSGVSVSATFQTPIPGGAPDVPVSGSAVLGPNGSAQFPNGSVAPPTIRLTNGSGSVEATGAPGGIMDVVLNQLTISAPGKADLVCIPIGEPVILVSVPLKPTPSPTTTVPPAPPVPAPPTPPARAVAAEPSYTG
jgi:hypothetical protein